MKNYSPKTRRNRVRPKAPAARSRGAVRGPGIGTPAVQRVIGPPVIGPMPPDVALTLQQLLGNKAVRAMLGFEGEGINEEALQEEVSGEEKKEATFTQEDIDQIVTEMTAELLEKYQNIPVVVKEERPLPGAEGGQTSTPAAEQGAGGGASDAASQEEAAPTGEVPAPASQEQPAPAEKRSETVTKKLTVKAFYYMNTGNEEIKDARKAAGFDKIANSLGDQLSELNGKGGRLSAGRAVKYGKASPEDLGLFINKAVADGAVHKYGRSEGSLAEGDLLVDLGDEALKDLVEGWMYNVRAGVDCTGLVNIALVRAREKVRDEMREAGVPEEDLPRSLARQQRPHKGKEVTKAKDLRPGDIWVTRKGAHVRMVMEAYENTNKHDKPVIEFKTAESASSDALGPTDKTWQTKSLTAIHDLKNIEGRGSKDGQFYRVKEPRKKKS